MDTIIITELEPSVVESLQAAAATHGRTVEEEAAMLIRLGLARSPDLTRRQRADAIAAMTPKGVQQTDSTQLIREDRDREI